MSATPGVAPSHRNSATANFQLHYGYGFGIRVITPIGPLRLDYGFNGENGHELHFGMGSTFKEMPEAGFSNGLEDPASGLLCT